MFGTRAYPQWSWWPCRLPWIQVSRGHRHILGRGHSLMRFSSVMGMIMQSLCLTRASLSLSQETAKSWKGKDRGGLQNGVQCLYCPVRLRGYPSLKTQWGSSFPGDLGPSPFPRRAFPVPPCPPRQATDVFSKGLKVKGFFWLLSFFSPGNL